MDFTSAKGSLRRNISSGPPVCEKLPGVFDETGGCRIPIRARIGLRSRKVGNRGTYRGRIGDGPDREKWVPGGSILRGFTVWKMGCCVPDFSFCRPGKFPKFFVNFFGCGKNFRKIFWNVFGNYFWRGKLFLKMKNLKPERMFFGLWIFLLQ